MPASNPRNDQSATTPQNEDLRLDGVIGEDFWTEGITVGWVQEQLAQRPGDLTIWLNSPGGDVIEGSRIYTAIREHQGRVRICIDGIAASAASVIAMAADELCMAPTAYLMIHRASTIAWGNQDAMDEASRQLSAVDEGIIEAYRLKTGMSRKKIHQMMVEETWLNARAARDQGFADTILYLDDQQSDEDEQEEQQGQPTDHSARRFAASMRPIVYACGGMRNAPPAPQPPQPEPEKPADPPVSPAGMTDAEIQRQQARLALFNTIGQL